MIPLGSGVRTTCLRVGARLDPASVAAGGRRAEAVCFVGGSDGGVRCIMLSNMNKSLKGQLAWQVNLPRCLAAVALTWRALPSRLPQTGGTISQQSRA